MFFTREFTPEVECVEDLTLGEINEKGQIKKEPKHKINKFRYLPKNDFDYKHNDSDLSEYYKPKQERLRAD